MRKVALITGGSQGLGKEIARELLSDYIVVVISNDKDSLKEVAEELKVAPLLCDISNAKEVEEVTKTIIEEFGRVDVLVNNAGIGTYGFAENTSYEEMSRVIDINLKGYMYFSKAVVPQMKKQEGGKILNISSYSVITLDEEKSIYAASKAGVSAFGEVLRKELAPFNIAVMDLRPSTIMTGFHKKAGVDRDFSQALDAKDVAKVATFMLSFENLSFPDVSLRHINRP